MYGESGIEIRMFFGTQTISNFYFCIKKKNIQIEFTIFVSKQTILLKNSTLFYLTLRYGGRYMQQFSILGLNFSELGG